MSTDKVWWPLASGSAVQVSTGPLEPVPDTAHSRVTATVVGSESESREVSVVLDDLTYQGTLRKGNGLPALDDAGWRGVARSAALHAAAEEPEFFEDSTPLEIALDFTGVTSLFENATPLDDRGIRTYLARRLYHAWRADGFDILVHLSAEDTSLTGADYAGFVRNVQILEQEGYLNFHRSMGQDLSALRIVGTAKLIREVERFGAPRPDVELEPEYEATVRMLPALADSLSEILEERQRYELARHASDLASVFRATMPIVESHVRKLLESHGCSKHFSSLGPMIGELRSRGIGDIDMLSQLSALQHNVRDISLHGGSLPTGTLRIACETCFAVLPLLGRSTKPSV